MIAAVVGMAAMAVVARGQVGPAVGLQPERIVLANVTLIDGTGALPRRAVTVVTERGVIAGIRPASARDAREPGIVVDGRGKFLIPGLWDMHTHIWAEDLLPLYVANGITGVRDMGAALAPWKAWRENIRTGKTVGPRAVVAGQIIDALPPKYFGWTQIASEEEARTTVRRLKDEGADFIKVYDRLAASEYFAILDEAAKSGLVVAGHVPAAVRVTDAAAAGHRSTEHLIGIALEASSDEEALRKKALGIRETLVAVPEKAEANLGAFYEVVRYEPLASMDQAKLLRMLRQMRSRRTWHVPTLVVRRPPAPPLVRRLEDQLKHFPAFLRPIVIPPGMVETQRAADRSAAAIRLVSLMHREGLPLLAGSDGGNPTTVPAFSLHDELAMLVQAGLSPMQALQTATKNAAAYFERERGLGTVEQGKAADLVLLDANPLVDIRNTARVSGVIAGGRLISAAEIGAIKKEASTRAAGRR